MFVPGTVFAAPSHLSNYAVQTVPLFGQPLRQPSSPARPYTPTRAHSHQRRPLLIHTLNPHLSHAGTNLASCASTKNPHNAGRRLRVPSERQVRSDKTRPPATQVAQIHNPRAFSRYSLTAPRKLVDPHGYIFSSLILHSFSFFSLLSNSWLCGSCPALALGIKARAGITTATSPRQSWVNTTSIL